MTSPNKNVSHHTARASLLHVIGTEKPHSLQALADLVGRKQTNLSRTLKKLEEAGIVRLDPGPRHTVAPRLVVTRHARSRSSLACFTLPDTALVRAAAYQSLISNPKAGTNRDSTRSKFVPRETGPLWASGHTT